MQQALSVQITGTQTMGREIYLYMLEKKLETLILADPKAARWAMECTFDSIATYYDPKDWAIQIVRGDRMTMILADVDWDASLGAAPQQSLAEILEILA